MCLDVPNFSDLSSGCRSGFYAGWQPGRGEADRSGHRQRAGCGGGPRPDPKGTEPDTEPRIPVSFTTLNC